MTERDRPSNDALEPAIADDLRALREATARDLPGLPGGVTPRYTRPSKGLSWKEQWMSTVLQTKGRPWIVTGLAAATIALALLVIPISYERTTSHDVQLAVANVGQDQMRGIATELKAALGIEHVMVRAETQGENTTLTFEASVPATNRVDVATVANAFASELTARGFEATATTTPIRETVSGNVYAYARDRVIRVETAGKSAAQIEAEIRDQIAAAGLTDTKVSVTDEGPNMRKVTVQAKHTTDQPGTAEPENLTLELTKNGQPIGGEGENVSLQVKKMKTSTGMNLHLDVKVGAQTAAVDIANADGMSDTALSEAIRTQLAAKGINVKVKVENGQFQIEKI